MPNLITSLRPTEVSYVDRGANRRPFFLVKSEDGDLEASFDDVLALAKDGAISQDHIKDLGLSEELAKQLQTAISEYLSKEGNTMPNKIDVSHITKDGSAIDPALVPEALRPLAEQLVEAGVEATGGTIDLDALDKAVAPIVKSLADATEKEPAKPEPTPEPAAPPVDLDSFRKEDGSIDVDKVPEQFQSIAKSMNTQAAELEKQRDELTAERSVRLRKAFEEQAASDYSLVDGAEPLGAFLHKASTQMDAETFEQLQKLLGAVQEKISKGDIFSEAGSQVPGSIGADSALGKLNAISKDLQTKNPDMSDAQAFTKAMDQNPELYQEYKAELSRSH